MMSQLVRRTIAIAGLAALLGGCVVEERTVVRRPPPPCNGALWIPGHTGQSGNWRPGHWRCPGVVEVVVVD